MLFMKHFRYYLFFIILGIVLSPLFANAVVQYTVTDLGSFGGDSTTAYGVNDLGLVVGRSENISSDRIAYLWESGVLINLGYSGDSESEARSINNFGQVAGFYQSLNGDGAFLWLPEPAYGLPAGMNNLGTLGGPSSAANDINNKGQIVGRSFPSLEMVPSHAFLWENGIMQDLGTLEGDFSSAFAINDAGQVVGIADYKIGDPVNAFIWLPEPAYGLPAGMNRIGSDPSIGLAAFDINNSGYVVGFQSGESPDQRAILWQAGASNELQILIEERSTATAINDSGWVVGRFDAQPGTSLNHAFIFRDGQVTDLNNLIDPNSGWILTSASDISNSGFIVGIGQKDGVSRAFILTPVPEPSSFAFAFGAFIIIASRSALTHLKTQHNHLRSRCRL